VSGSPPEARGLDASGAAGASGPKLDAAAWGTALATGAPSEPLARYLARQRWAGARGGALRTATVEHVLPFPTAPSAFAIAIVTADGADGSRVRYQLPVATHPLPSAPGSPHADAELIVSPARGGHGVREATVDPTFRQLLHRFVAAGGGVSDGVAELRGEPLAPVLAGAPGSTVLGAEQSNTSIVYDDGSIVKLFRRVEIGENPDVEIGRALATLADAPNVPRLLGAMRYADAGGSATLAMRQQLVAGARDAWAYTLDTARGDLEAARSGAFHAAYPLDAERLGVATRRLHESLAALRDDPAFAPEPATRADVARWAAGAGTSVERGLDLLERQLAAGAVVGPLADEAANLIAWRDAFLARTVATAELVGDDAGLRIRHHGDFHLGQVLRAENGDFFIIDFEGEPLRPLAERRHKHSALRDVAGMLRSFSYAAATVAAERGGAAEPGHAPDPRAAAWEESARRAFLRGYIGTGQGTAVPFLPSAPERAEALVALFETEKVFYELAYELHNRPAWVWIPLLGIAQLLAR
jgi:maltose alpha-D-glucosyltransferase/alpha-amylase